MLLALNLICILLYVVATVSVATRWFHKDGPLIKLSIVASGVAIVLHLLILLNSILSGDGQNLSIVNVGSITALLITAVIWLLSLRNQQTFLLPLVTGFSAIAVLVASFTPGSVIMHIELRPSLLAHISFALLAYGCLSIAFLYALQLSFINRRLKQKNAVIIHSSLPPLMEVEQNLFRLIMLGTGLLTLSLASGFFFLENMFEQRQVHKTILTTITWFMYVGMIVVHKRVGLKDNTIISLSVVGVVLLTLAYFGSRVVKEVLIG